MCKTNEDMYFVPNISHRFLSVHKILENGFKFFVEINQCQIKDEDGKKIIQCNDEEK